VPPGDVAERPGSVNIVLRKHCKSIDHYESYVRQLVVEKTAMMRQVPGVVEVGLVILFSADIA